MKLAFLHIYFCVSVCSISGQNLAALDSFFNIFKKNNNLMGSIAISKGGKMLYTKSIGYSIYNENQKVWATGKTKYRIGSISKTFTACIIFQLIEEGRLSLTTPLEKYFPGFPNAKLITISDMLNHRSSIRNIVSIKNSQQPRTEQEMMSIISKGKQLFPPGSKTAYSNANYLILGYIIEKIVNKPFGEVLKERLSKTGLFDTYYSNDPHVKGLESFSYKFKDDWVQLPNMDPSIIGASGGILSTPTDLAHFMEALFNQQLISLSSIMKMKTITENYGMGMLEFDLHLKKAYGQIGGIDQYESVVAYFPADSLAVALCVNGHTKSVKNIIVKGLDIFFNYTYQKTDAELVNRGH